MLRHQVNSNLDDSLEPNYHIRHDDLTGTTSRLELEYVGLLGAESRSFNDLVNRPERGCVLTQCASKDFLPVGDDLKHQVLAVSVRIYTKSQDAWLCPFQVRPRPTVVVE